MSAKENLPDSSTGLSAQGTGMSDRRPTHALRLRAFANQFISVVLKDEHEPFKDPQAALGRARRRAELQATNDGVLDKELRPALAFQEKTVGSWWRGEVEKPHDEKIALCERFAKGSSRWLEFSMYGNAIQRHMDALDVRCDDRLLETFRPGTEDWMSPRLARLDKCMGVADRCWSVLTSSATPDLETIGLASRMAPGGVMPAPSFMFPAPLPASWVSEGRVNGYMFDVPPSVRAHHTASSRFGLLESLVRLGTLFEGAEPRPWWYSGLVFDLASCASMALVFALFGPRWSPAANVGQAWVLIDTVNRSLFESEEVGASALAKHGPVIAAEMGVPAMVLCRFLCDARREYYRQLSSFGISSFDIYSVTNPEVASASPVFVRAA